MKFYCDIIVVSLCDLAVSSQRQKPSPFIKNYEEILAWKAPYSIQTAFVYYLSGYDPEGVPVWIQEVGRYDIKKFAEGSEKDRENLKKNTDQFYARIEKSILDANVTEYIYIADFEGYSASQFTSPEAVRIMTNTLLGRQNYYRERMKTSIVLNANVIFETLWSTILKPLVGSYSERIQIFGTNSNVWKPWLVKNLGKKAIPTFYGGEPDHKPVAVYG